ncbi:MAG: altronate hydrolase, partial [Anaerolineae bacterium]|nr:altronate hydrolase [Anaerolineae bacterium]
QIANQLQTELQGRPISRVVALPHTEGCGYSYGGGADLFVRSLLGHLTHPSVSLGMVLEHGCDKVHNGVLRDQLRRRGLDTTRYGWASIQLDGGVEKVTQRVVDWFRQSMEGMETSEVMTDFKELSVGFVSGQSLPDPLS